MRAALLLMAASAAWSADCGTLYSPYKSERELVEKFAPRFLQWVGDPEVYDIFAPIDFDEGANRPDKAHWNTTDNAEHAANPEFEEQFRPVIYGGLVAATRNQWYLVYYYYHPVDRGAFFTRTIGDALGWLTGLGRGHHENDLEGGYVIVDRTRSEPMHYSALAHNGFDDRHAQDDFAAGDPVIIVSEGGKHGAKLIQKTVALSKQLSFWEGLTGSRSLLIDYRLQPGIDEHAFRAADLSSRSDIRQILERDRGVPYRIELLWPFFASMFPEGRRACASNWFWTRPKTISRPKLARGAVREGRVDYSTGTGNLTWCTALKGHQDDQAKFPWGQVQDMERFFDPVWNLLARERNGHRGAHSEITTGYLFNPYLQAVLTGSVPEWTESSCPDFRETP